MSRNCHGLLAVTVEHIRPEMAIFQVLGAFQSWKPSPHNDTDKLRFDLETSSASEVTLELQDAGLEFDGLDFFVTTYPEEELEAAPPAANGGDRRSLAPGRCCRIGSGGRGCIMTTTRRDMFATPPAVALPTVVSSALPGVRDPNYLLCMICRAFVRLSVATQALSDQLDVLDDQGRPVDSVERLRLLKEAMPTPDQIVEMLARTLSGVRTKAEALSQWLLRNPDGTHLQGEQVMGSVVEDLLRLKGPAARSPRPPSQDRAHLLCSPPAGLGLATECPDLRAGLPRCYSRGLRRGSSYYANHRAHQVWLDVEAP